MKKFLLLVFTFVLCSLFSVLPPTVFAQTATQDQLVAGKVVRVLGEGQREIAGYNNPYQTVQVEILGGEDARTVVQIEHGSLFSITSLQKVKEGEKVLLTKTSVAGGESSYFIVDKYRIDKLLWFAGIFLVLVLAMGRLQGLGSILGLVVSLAVIVKFVVPYILKGADPLIVSVAGAFVIMFTTLYLAHGFNKKTHVALLATFVVLTFASLLSFAFVYLAQLTGLGDESSYALRFGVTSEINFRGLLLGGMIIGILGILDDVTTSQASIVAELVRAKPKISFLEAVRAALSVGREHIASLVNTLVLVYAGVSLPVFIFFVLNPAGQPLWVLINSEFISEEIVRTLAGSIGLVFAVPITTLLAAWVFVGKGGK